MVVTFHRSRRKTTAKEIRSSLGQIFLHQSGFSAEDLAFIFGDLDDAELLEWTVAVLQEAKGYVDEKGESFRLDRLVFSRIIHTLGSAIKLNLSEKEKEWTKKLQSIHKRLSNQDKEWLNSLGLDTQAFQDAKTWCEKAQDSAFENLSQTIVRSKKKSETYPQCAVRSDEIIWGRAPGRLDLGGGWTDTPPYALEHGGYVINAAVNLNGQPPIHVYSRIVEDPEIRIASIDHGLRVTIKDLESLMDYRKATSEFGLAKAALVLSGFSLDKATWPNGIKTLEYMLERFGGGIELTTLAAIPSGSCSTWCSNLSRN